MQARRNLRPLEARLAYGKGDTAQNYGSPLIAASGIIGSQETILMSDTVDWSCLETGFQCGIWPIWAAELVETRHDKTAPYDLCIRDGLNEYDEERFEHGHHEDDDPFLLPCLAYGLHKRVSYSIRLSHAVSVSLTFDVVVVPTSWWFARDAFSSASAFHVIQIADANESPKSAIVTRDYGYTRRFGYHVVGWAADREWTTDDEDALCLYNKIQLHSIGQ